MRLSWVMYRRARVTSRQGGATSPATIASAACCTSASSSSLSSPSSWSSSTEVHVRERDETHFDLMLDVVHHMSCGPSLSIAIRAWAHKGLQGCDLATLAFSNRLHLSSLLYLSSDGLQDAKIDAMQCNAMQCNAMQCNAMQCNAMQCNATQHSIM